MAYQCLVDGRSFYHPRWTWEEAARDAVNSGHAVWSLNAEGRAIKHDDAIEIVVISEARK